MIFLYHILSSFFVLLSPIYLGIRLLKGKENFTSILNRFSISNLKRPKGKLIWVHVASVGELNSAIALIKKILKETNNNILLTSCTVTSSKIAETKLGSKVSYHFLPFDNFLIASIFLAKWRPNKILWFESEIWPATISAAHSHSILILLNARMSDRSYEKWQKFPNLAKNILDKFSLIIAGSKNSSLKFKNLGHENVLYHGNLKFSAMIEFQEESEKQEKIINQWQQALKSNKVIIFASTHKGEEEIALRIYKEMKVTIPNLTFIIAPRHVNRKLDLLKNSKFQIIHSSENRIESCDFLLVDELGKLSTFYKVADFAFVGGSIICHGGQNPLEAISLGTPVLSGPNIFNFTEIYQFLTQEKAAIITKNESELEAKIMELLSNEKELRNFKNFAYELQKSSNEVLEIIFNLIMIE